MKKILLWMLLLLLTGCIEYRWEARNALPERYFATPYNNNEGRSKQDPRLGSKARVYLNNRGNVRFYIGGHYSKTRLTGNMGMIYYPTRMISYEIGYRSFLQEFSDHYSDHSTRVTWYNDENMENMFYIGGKIRF